MAYNSFLYITGLHLYFVKEFCVYSWELLSVVFFFHTVILILGVITSFIEWVGKNAFTFSVSWKRMYRIGVNSLDGGYSSSLKLSGLPYFLFGCF